jgi:U32 family peptidase
MDSTCNLLAPAGSWETLYAAIKAGADSVYFGLEHLNMRARAAKRLQLDDLPRLADVCRKNKVESYLAVNTLIYDQDLHLLQTILKNAADSGISAVIATDVAAISMAREMGLSVHISTQANISNLRAVRFFSCFADVMVLARELTLEQIKAIVQRIAEEQITGPTGELVQIELFVHGALCISVSGKCDMSLALTNHSANRGDCLQSCRRSYRVIDDATGEELKVENRFVMSPRDLCTIHMIDQLIDAGVRVFKIEGRGRPADYVYKVTHAYRKAIDACLDGSYTEAKRQKWQKELETVFNRGFWQGGYYLGEVVGEWSASYGSRATIEKVYLGHALNYFQKSKIGYFKIEDSVVTCGDKVAIIGPTTGYVETTVDSIFCDEEPVGEGRLGMRITFPVQQKIRKNDKLYLLRPRQRFQS